MTFINSLHAWVILHVFVLSSSNVFGVGPVSADIGIVLSYVQGVS